MVDETALDHILSALCNHLGAELRWYKKSMLARAIQKRLAQQRIGALADYRDQVVADPSEIEALSEQLFAPVSRFFRDAKAWRVLADHVIPETLKRFDEAQPLRVWVPGCATGEDAYSAAMLLQFHSAARGKDVDVQVFATDINRRGLDVARAGVYPARLGADLPPGYLKRFFTKKERSLHVVKSLRDTVVFAPQNVLGDPPLSNVDLVICRNLLIYLDRAGKERLLSLLHYALNDKGVLFLGALENTRSQEQLFETVSKKWRIYRRNHSTRPEAFDEIPFRTSSSPSSFSAVSSSDVSETRLRSEIERDLLRRYAPALVVIDSSFRVRFFHGETTPYLTLPTGSPTQNLLRLLVQELRARVRDAVMDASEGQEEAVITAPFPTSNGPDEVRITVSPLQLRHTGLLAVSFEKVDLSGSKAVKERSTRQRRGSRAPRTSSTHRSLEQELRDRDEQAFFTEEELRTASEELMTMNEELQASNQELEASKVELQSLNEELSVTNRELRHKVKELKATTNDLTNLLGNTDVAALFLDTDLRLRLFTPGMERHLKLLPSDVGRPLDAIRQLEDDRLHHEARKALQELVTEEREIQTAGGRTYVRRVSPYRTPEGSVGGVVVNSIDISDLKRTEDKLFAEKERLEVTLDSIGDAVIAANADGDVEYMNPVAQALTGWTADDARGRPLKNVFQIVREGSDEPADDPTVRYLHQKSAERLEHRVVLVSRDGQRYAIQDSAAPIRGRNGDVRGVVLVFRDVTRTRHMERELSYQATHDHLTGLVNRAAFEQRLEAVLESAQTRKTEHALCYLDLDQFKIINDTCGHVAGDDLLRQIARLLERRLRKRDTLARLGGDEFGVIMEHCTLQQAKGVADSLCREIEGFRFVWEDKTFNIGVSIGLVPIDGLSRDLTRLLSAADEACYVAKDVGRNRVHVWRPDDAELAKRQGEMRWVARINRALEENRFTLSYQPIVALGNETNLADRFELLVRMIDEDGRMVKPSAFLPAAERYNLSVKLDRWVTSRALNWLNTHPLHINGMELCAINLSGQSLGEEWFLDFLVAEVKRLRFHPELLCFEITETAAVADLGSAREFIETLRDLGCRFALDDFGTGVSSFAYLKSLPVDYLKIDGHFVKDITEDRIHLAMVRSINEIAKSMGKQTVAEFVVNHAVLAALKSEKVAVDYAQGYGIARPQPLDRLPERP